MLDPSPLRGGGNPQRQKAAVCCLMFLNTSIPRQRSWIAQPEHGNAIAASRRPFSGAKIRADFGPLLYSEMPNLRNAAKERFFFDFKLTAVQPIRLLDMHFGVVGVVGSNPAAPINNKNYR